VAATEGQWLPEDSDSGWRTTHMSEEDDRGSRMAVTERWLAT
jgi:hypothetical protein